MSWWVATATAAILTGLTLLWTSQRRLGIALLIGGGILGLVGVILWRRETTASRIQIQWAKRNEPAGDLYRSEARVTLPNPISNLIITIHGYTIRDTDIRPMQPVGILSIGRRVAKDGVTLTVQQAAGTYLVTVMAATREALTITRN